MAGILRKIFIDVELLNHINSSPAEIRTGVYNTDSEKHVCGISKIVIQMEGKQKNIPLWRRYVDGLYTKDDVQLLKDELNSDSSDYRSLDSLRPKSGKSRLYSNIILIWNARNIKRGTDAFEAAGT